MTDKAIFSADAIPLPSLRYADPLGIVRSDLRKALGEGEAVECPCCGQQARVYSRPINATMIRALHEIAISPFGLTNAAIIARTHQAGGGNVSLLQHWGFVESWPGHVWRATPAGRNFLRGLFRVPSRVLLYANIFLGLDERETVSVRDVAGREFDLSSATDPAAAVGAEVVDAAE